MITLAAADTLRGKAGTATAVTYSVFADRFDTTDHFERIAQGQLPSSTTTLYTVPAATTVLIRAIHLANTTGSPVTGVTFYTGGSAATNQDTGTITIPANGTAFYDGTWHIYGSDGIVLTTIGGAAGGDLTGAYPNPTIKTDVALPGNPTTTTQAPGDNSTKISTTAYADSAANAKVVDSIADADTTRAPSRNSVFDALVLKEDTANKATDLSVLNNTKYPTTQAVNNAITSAVAGLYDDRGNFNASVNAYPSSGGSGAAGAILKGDVWTVSVAGTLPTGQDVEPGDLVRALVDTPGNTQTNWAITQNNIGYVAENQANKSNDSTMAANSATLYPSQQAARGYADGKVVDSIADADTVRAPSRNAVFDALALKANTSALGTASTKNTGNTVIDPGTGKLETTMPTLGLVTGANRVYTSAERGYAVRRSNSGAAMSDTLPTLTNTAADIGASYFIYNEDTALAAVLTVNAGGGAQFRSGTGTLSATSPINYGSRQSFVWDGTNWNLFAGNANLLRRSGTIIAGNFPKWVDTAGNGVIDSGFPAALSTTTTPGFQSQWDKKKQDNLWYDVTTWDTTGTNNLVGDDSTDNVSRWTALFAVLPVGATVYFPPGTYRTSGAFAITADKHLTIKGANKYASIIKTTSTTADGFTIAGGQYWYNSFSDLRFETTMLNKTAGAAILISTVGLGANTQQVGINVYRCSFSNWFKAIYALADPTNGTTQGPGNLSIWDSLDISITGSTGPVNSRGIHINGAGTNLVISNSTINMGYPPFQVATTAAIEINASGAIQMVNGEFIGGTNTLLLSADASTGTNNSVAAVYATNCFFDQSSASTVKIAGANVVNRCKFVQCGITTGVGAVAGYKAVEINSAGTGAAGTATAKADGIDFFDCDIYANGGTNPVGFDIAGAQGVTINNCRISGGGTALTTGIQVTPTVSAGYTKVIITGNKIGSTNNFTSGITTGVNLGAGAPQQYGVIQITGNDFTGSVTPLVDASTIGPTHSKDISSNIGLSPGDSLPALASGAGSLLANNGRGAITGTTVETFLCTFRIPPNAAQVGDIIHIQALIQGNATGTNFTPRIRVGAAGTIADAAVLLVGTLNTGVANSWHIVNAYVYVVALGPTATVYATLGTQGTSASSAAVAAAEAPGNVPTTAAWFITLTGQSAANGHLIRSIRARFI